MYGPGTETVRVGQNHRLNQHFDKPISILKQLNLREKSYHNVCGYYLVICDKWVYTLIFRNNGFILKHWWQINVVVYICNCSPSRLQSFSQHNVFRERYFVCIFLLVLYRLSSTGVRCWYFCSHKNVGLIGCRAIMGYGAPCDYIIYTSSMSLMVRVVLM